MQGGIASTINPINVSPEIDSQGDRFERKPFFAISIVKPTVKQESPLPIVSSFNCSYERRFETTLDARGTNATRPSLNGHEALESSERRIAPFINQRPHDFRFAIPGGQPNWRRAYKCWPQCPIHAGASEWGPFFKSCVWIRTMRQQRTDHQKLTSQDRRVKRCVPGIHRINVGPGFQ